MSTLRRTCLALMLAGLAGVLPLTVAAHSGLRFSSPLDGATLGDSPAAIVLTFFEKPEPSLSTIHVIDTNGVAYHGNRRRSSRRRRVSTSGPANRPAS